MTIPVLLGFAGIVAALLLINRADSRRAQRQRVEAAADELLGGQPARHNERPRLLLTMVALATLFGALASGIALATVATGWRKGIAVLLIGYTGTDEADPTLEALPPELDAVAAELNLPDSLDGIRAEGRRRLIAALLDDARISDVTNRICPYVAGDPDRTPDEPVRSATTELERELTKLKATTTTTTQPGD